MLLTSSKAELTNKVIISIGSEIITNYDLDREIKYLNVITVGRIGELDNQESKKIAIDSLIKDFTSSSDTLPSLCEPCI